MRIQYMSDLHMELYDNSRYNPESLIGTKYEYLLHEYDDKLSE